MRIPKTRPERAIGVIYLPEIERISDCSDVRLAEQFGVVLHDDRTQAVEPSGRSAETFPVGI